MKGFVWLIFAAVLLLGGVLVFKERQSVAVLREQVALLKREGAADKDEIARLNEALHSSRLANAAINEDRAKLRNAAMENKTLRSQLANARTETTNSSTNQPQDAFTQTVGTYSAKAAALYDRLQARPNEQIPELGLLTVTDWLAVAKDANLDTDADVRDALAKLREAAKAKLPFGSALYSYTQANQGNLPTDMAQLVPYFNVPVDESVLGRYTISRAGNVSDLPQDSWVIVERSPVDQQYDSRAKFGIGTSTVISTGVGHAGDPDDPNYGSQQ